MLSKDLLQQFEDNITRFDENIHAFENGEIDRQTFKGISGGFGSYAQKEQGYMPARPSSFTICLQTLFRSLFVMP